VLRSLTLLVAAALAADPAPGRGGEPAGPVAGVRGDFARVVVRDGDRQRSIEGRIVVEAVDGGLLVELADQRYRPLQPSEIVSREPLPQPPQEAGRDLGRRVLAELPAGFDLHVTKHYVLCFGTSREYAKWAAAVFERLHETFGNYWRRAGVDLHDTDDASRPLVVVIFADRHGYETHAARDVGSAADRVVGYYNLLTNRVVTYDLTAADARPAGGGGGGGRSGRRGLEFLAQPESALLVSTLVHEATHQMAFNSGMHRRLAPVPLWVSEGIATTFEPADLRHQSGWRGLGSINRPRLDRFRKAYHPGCLEAVVATDDAFRAADTAIDAYAMAWALAWFLMETRRDDFVGYLRGLAGREPLTEYPREERLRDFAAAFGGTPAEIEPALVRAMARIELRKP
jgi:hypothetical protein